jgi:hypothetical protein
VTGVSLPGKDRVPPGAHRDLLKALHGLYQGAGRPSLRRIAIAVTADEQLPDTISHEKVSALLHGAGLPRWSKVEGVVRQLAAWHSPRRDPDAEAARFLKLWLAADEAREAGGSRVAPELMATPVPQGRPADRVTSAPGGPALIRGRDEIIRQLIRDLNPEHIPGRPQVLGGVAGIGKSTIVSIVRDQASRQDPPRRAWWVFAADEDVLSRHLADLARDLGVAEAYWGRLGTRPAADLTEVADQVWEALERAPAGWLLVIDNADDPRLLGPQDGTAWVRATTRGLVLVTTRAQDPASWPGSDLRQVDPLRPDDAAGVLTDLAPAAGDRSAARALARRLGYLPIALRVAGTSLRQDPTQAGTFEAARRALDPDTDATEYALDRTRVPQTRPLLWMLACYAPSSVIPEAVVAGAAVGGVHPLAPLLDPGRRLPPGQLAQFGRAGLQELESADLIDLPAAEDRPMIRVHAAITEDVRTAMARGPAVASRPDIGLVRATAVAAACAFVRTLDTGSADHWPYFRIMTPHVEELLAGTAPHLGPRDCQHLITCMVRCVAAHLWSKAERRAEQLSSRAMELAAGLGSPDAYLRLRHVHAVARRDLGYPAEAAEEFQDILAAQVRVTNGATSLDALRTRQQLAWTLGRLGRWAEAEAGLREVIRLLDLRQQQRWAEDRDARVLRLHVRCMTNWSVGCLGRWAEAEQGYRELITDREEELGPEHPDTLDARFDVGKALAWQGKWVAAENEWRHNADDRQKALGAHHPDTLLTRQLQFYAGGYRAWKNEDKHGQRLAVAGLEMVLNVQREKRGEDHGETNETRTLLAALHSGYTPGMTWPEDLPRPGMP